MRIAILSLALVFGTAAFANDELDQERSVAQAPAPSADQIAKAKELPQTTVIRVSKKDPSKVEVVFLKEKVPAGKKLTGLQFEQMALNGEKTGIAYAAADELDAVSSTSSWSFGYARGPRGNSAGFVRGPYGAAGFVNGRYGVAAGGYYNGGYYGAGYGYGGYYGGAAYGYGYGGCGSSCGGGCYSGGCGGCGGCGAYYPTYAYAGYNYNYQPYYGWSDPYYDYAYCNWVY